MSKEMKKQLYQESQKLINEQSRVMDEGSEIGIHDEMTGGVYRKVHERKPLIVQSINFMDNHLDLNIVGKKNFERFREITKDSDWIVSNFYGDDLHETEKWIEEKWGIFKQRLNRSLQSFQEIEKEYKAKKIIV